MSLLACMQLQLLAIGCCSADAIGIPFMHYINAEIKSTPASNKIACIMLHRQDHYLRPYQPNTFLIYHKYKHPKFEWISQLFQALLLAANEGKVGCPGCSQRRRHNQRLN